jgi:hypothetical protein
MVTRLPERFIDPSTRPSIYKDSEPVTSPLITSDLPMVAWSDVVVVTGREAGAGSLELIIDEDEGEDPGPVPGAGAVGAVDMFGRSGWPGVAG